MQLGLSEHIDLTLILLYLFWAFFFGLVVYLNREGMREGFPLVSDIGNKPQGWGLVGAPYAKEFKLPNGESVFAPTQEKIDYPIKARPAAPFGGAPYEPEGDPMLSEFGAGAYAERRDEPLLMLHGQLKIAPLRDMPDFHVVEGDQDPIGLPVYGADGVLAGYVSDIWIDREEQLIRYLEVDLSSTDVEPENRVAAKVLTPMTLARIGGRWVRMGVWAPRVDVRSILAKHFQLVPQTKAANQVTLLEEDKITAFYGGGTLYATPDRREPLV